MGKGTPLILLLLSICCAVLLLGGILLARLGDDVVAFATFVSTVEDRGRTRFFLRLGLYAAAAGAIGLSFGLGAFHAAAIFVWLVALEYSASAWTLVTAFKRTRGDHGNLRAPR